MKFVEKVQLLLKLNTNISHFAWRPKYILLLQKIPIKVLLLATCNATMQEECIVSVE